MAVQFSSAAVMPSADSSVVFTTAASGDVEGSININPTASDIMAIGAVYFNSVADASGGTLGLTIDGVAMNPLGDPIYYDSNKFRLQLFSLAGPTAGPGKAVVASYSGMGSANGKMLIPIVVTYAGVASASAVTTAGGSSTTANSVTVTSVAEAHRTVFVNAAGSPMVSGHNNLIATWAGYSQTLRAQGIEQFTTRMVLQDAPGDTSIVGTATNAFANAFWAAAGVDLLPAVVMGDASLTVYVNTATGATFFRDRTPDARRYLKIDR